MISENYQNHVEAQQKFGRGAFYQKLTTFKYTTIIAGFKPEGCYPASAFDWRWAALIKGLWPNGPFTGEVSLNTTGPMCICRTG